MKKDLLSIRDLTFEDVGAIMETALKIKANIPGYYGIFTGKNGGSYFR